MPNNTNACGLSRCLIIRTERRRGGIGRRNLICCSGAFDISSEAFDRIDHATCFNSLTIPRRAREIVQKKSRLV
jgi:hypothetical protein